MPAEFVDHWLDEHDEHASHWACFISRRLVGAARLCVHASLRVVPHARLFDELLPSEGPYASINRLVVAPEARGLGVARHLDDVRLAFIDGLRLTTVAFVWRASGPERLGALIRRGFNPMSGADWVEEPPFGAALALVRPAHGTKVP